MLCLNHKVSKFTASHNSNLSHDWNDIQFIIDRRPLRDFVAGAPTSRSACSGALNDEISHAERAFSLLLERSATPEQRERQADIADLLLEEMLKRK